ncbi:MULTISPECIES: hypothetical protein [unclassified Beijerinckia]|uniref:hypothetical protein n=1 Tax=unclassified Beijerinckia TaxID=2638183 RepID=UPI00089A80A4|nr:MULTISPECIES: hypothetical protein [unclassified Beijerinckia]MDH7798685.1 hypothetical protein [Beijerinckia sp. GAS462]SED29366.1 hypothetical protein SAMN05443249_4985 [Beijerinckia sp. 28-YEA-48]
MSISCRNVLIGEVLLGAGYLIGTATSHTTVVAISASSQIQEAAADMTAKSAPMGLWLLVACSVLFLGLCVIGSRKWKYQGLISDEHLGVGGSRQAKWMRTFTAWARIVTRRAGSRCESQKNPFGSDYAHLKFEDRVQMAGDQSLEDNQIMGVVCLSLHSSSSDEVAAQPELRSRILDLADEVRRALRVTDCVQVTEANEIAVFVSRLRSRSDLLETARRLSVLLAEKGDNLRFAAPGFALYPLHGYTSAELIDAARRNIVFIGRSLRQPAASQENSSNGEPETAAAGLGSPPMKLFPQFSDK